jgi:hypothetical protein
MLLIVNLVTNSDIFPVHALEDVDSVLLVAGFKREIRSVIKPGKEFSTTYEGPTVEKAQLEKLVARVAERNEISFSVECEESVRFP